MPHINSSANDKTDSAMEKTGPFLGNVTVSAQPMVICAVQRKANVGNFETVDAYIAVSVPLGDVSTDDMEAFTAAVEVAADKGFLLASKEVSSRYKVIKEAIK